MSILLESSDLMLAQRRHIMCKNKNDKRGWAIHRTPTAKPYILAEDIFNETYSEDGTGVSQGVKRTNLYAFAEGMYEMLPNGEKGDMDNKPWCELCGYNHNILQSYACRLKDNVDKSLLYNGVSLPEYLHIGGDCLDEISIQYTDPVTGELFYGKKAKQRRERKFRKQTDWYTALRWLKDKVKPRWYGAYRQANTQAYVNLESSIKETKGFLARLDSFIFKGCKYYMSPEFSIYLPYGILKEHYQGRGLSKLLAPYLKDETSKDFKCAQALLALAGSRAKRANIELRGKNLFKVDVGTALSLYHWVGQELGYDYV